MARKCQSHVARTTKILEPTCDREPEKFFVVTDPVVSVRTYVSLCRWCAQDMKISGTEVSEDDFAVFEVMTS